MPFPITDPTNGIVIKGRMGKGRPLPLASVFIESLNQHTEALHNLGVTELYYYNSREETVVIGVQAGGPLYSKRSELSGLFKEVQATLTAHECTSDLIEGSTGFGGEPPYICLLVTHGPSLLTPKQGS